ncbi:MAG: hypothetical protein IBX61_09985, partial [Thermoleophilia bacterium]|nr:hypothetical protein [Thermoleophilia bacterium]
MKTVEDILARVKSLGFTLERHGDELHLRRPAGSSPPPELIAAIQSHKPELMDHLAEALTPEQRKFWQPATGAK